MKLIITSLLFLLAISALGQTKSKAELELMEDEALLQYFTEIQNDSIAGEKVARVYLDRARKQNDTIKMARGYDRLARLFHPEKNIMFADSVIYLTQEINNKTYPAMGYVIKSYELQGIGDLVSSSKNAYIALEIATKKDNVAQIMYLSDKLIYEKSIWGDKEEALELQRNRHKLIAGPDFINNLRESTRNGRQGDIQNIYMENEFSSILNFAFCFLNLKKLDSVKFYLDKGYEINKNYIGSFRDDNIDWLDEASVELEYHSGNYNRAIEIANHMLYDKDFNRSNMSKFNLMVFLGFSYIKLDKLSSGIKYFQQADSIYDSSKLYLQPYHRELFEYLLEDTRKKGNKEKQIVYLNKLIKVDSVFKINYKYFEPNFIDNFETPWLLKEKEELIAGLERKNKRSKYGLWGGLSFLLLSLIALGYYIKQQALYKKRFQLLVAQNKNNTTKTIKNGTDKIEIGAKVIEEILKNLDQFEMDDQYLAKNLSLQSLASKFGTNTKYLSNVINLNREKSFPQYLNDLRVTFALKEITENSKFRKYTIKAIAADCGFNSAESFSKAFYKKHKVFPSYYIKKLEELKDD